MHSTYPSGRHVSLTNFSATDVQLSDIAQCLSRIPRWGGCSTRVITVEEHCLFTAHLSMQRSDNERLCLLMLLHDAHEAYIGDIRRGAAKELNLDTACLKARIDRGIFEALGVPLPDSEEKNIVKLIDDWAMALEARWYMPATIIDSIPFIESARDPGFRPPVRSWIDNGITWFNHVEDLR